MKIADLYASLQVKPDRSTFIRARRDVDKFTRETGRQFDGLKGKIRNAFFGAQGRNQSGQFTARGGGLFGMLGRGGSRGMSSLTKALGIGAAGFGLKALIGDALKFDDALTSLNISSKGAMGTMTQVRRQILAVSKATGVAKEDLLGGAAAFVALTGDGKAASEAMETFARVQKATQASMEDISGAAAALNQQFGIGAKDFERAFSILVAGGKEGKVELKEMAQFSSELAAQFKSFSGGTGVGGLAQMSAAFQVAARDFGGAGGGAAETATGLKALFSSFTSPRTLKALKELGVEIFTIGEDGTATLKSFPEIFDALANTDLVKDPRLLTKVFESSEARRAANAILQNVDRFRELSVATLKADDIATDYNARQASASAKAAKAWNDVKVAMAEAFTPERLQAFANILGTVVEAAARLVGSLQAVADWADRHSGEKKFTPQAGDFEQNLSDEELNEAMGLSPLEFSRKYSGRGLGGRNSSKVRFRNEILRRKDQAKGDIGTRAVLAASESVAQVRWAAAGGVGRMPAFAGGGGKSVTMSASPTINVNVPPGTDEAAAHRIAHVVEKTWRQLWEGEMRKADATLGGQ
jgi:TP901 family phage tail tape measure protein